MRIINRFIKNALGSRYGRSNVRVASGTGTARAWVEVMVRIARPHDCYCEKGNELCRMCLDARKNASNEARKIAYAAQAKSGEQFASYCTDDPSAESRDCFMLQVQLIEKNENN